MKTALIGYTGFVGSNIANQSIFGKYYNSSNISTITDDTFDLVICAGVPAVKWWANLHPDEDLATIRQLINLYRNIKARRFVLISTVDVYKMSIGVDEQTEIDINTLQPYGRHRFLLEQELKDFFKSFNVIRLPALFGPGLKKNILYDFVCNNQVEKINLDSSFQWYPLSRIWKDIQMTIENDLPVINMAVEPITTSVIKDRFFSTSSVSLDPMVKAEYDIRSIYGSHSIENGRGYLIGKDEVLQKMSKWLVSPEVRCG